MHQLKLKVVYTWKKNKNKNKDYPDCHIVQVTPPELVSSISVAKVLASRAGNTSLNLS